MNKQETNHIGETNKMVTAVDWLINELEEQNLIKLDKNKTVLFSKNFATRYELIIHEAKAMEKNQHSETFNQGVQWMQYQRDLVNGGAEYWDKEPSHFGEYYNETYEE